MTRIQTFRNRFSGCIVNGYVRIGCNFMDLDETVSSFIERYSPTAEPAGSFVFHGCVIHLVLHRQILNGVEYDEPVAAAIVDVDRALVFEIEFAKRMEQTVGGRSLTQIQRAIRFTARMGNNNLQSLGSIRSSRAGQTNFVASWFKCGIEPGPTRAFAAVLVVRAIPVVQKTANRTNAPLWLRPAVAGLVVGLVALIFPQIVGVGYGAMNDALNESYNLTFLFGLLIAKGFVVSVCMGLGFAGGMFSPALFLGAMLGGAFGIIATSAFPELSSGYSAYTLVGMGAVAAAVLGFIAITLVLPVSRGEPGSVPMVPVRRETSAEHPALEGSDHGGGTGSGSIG